MTAVGAGMEMEMEMGLEMVMDPLPTLVVKAEDPNKTQHPVDFSRMLFN